jgi:DNA-binding CsgD family transcriptional regulator
MGNHDSLRRQTSDHPGAIEPAVDQLVRRLIENDARLGPAVEADQIILDIEIEGVRYLAVRCRPRPQPGPEAEPGRAPPGTCPTLSPRESEIARMVAWGYANKTIASVLDISSWTVSSHLRRIFTKFGVTSRAAMVARLLDDSPRTESRTPHRSNHQRSWPSSAGSSSANVAGQEVSDPVRSRDALPKQTILQRR